ncbi:MAG: serine/threonine-protein kinase [Burkholderiaceae bacterium]
MDHARLARLARPPEAGARDEAPDADAQRLGPFELLRLLGSGAGGKVFAARDERNGALVALKVIDLGGDAGDRDAAALARERFVREALAVGRLRHPGLAEVFGAGQSGARGWLAMELAPGASLVRYATSTRLLPPGAVAWIGQRVALALAHAHREGVVHRDVKPANVIVDWTHGGVKLVDFGLARWAGRSITQSGQMLGSPDYMAPELMTGAEVGPAADLYALGVTLYELLAGRRPHSAPTLGALLRAVAREPAPELSALRPELPAALSRAVMALLAKVPARRAADAASLAHTLDAVAGVGHGVRA